MIKTKMLAALVVTSAVLYGATSTDLTEWSPEYNANNIDVSQELCIEGATTLTVTISGKTERKYDFIYVGDARFSGPLSEELEVSGPCVTARFTTDGTIITGDGPTVKIVEKNKDTVTWTPKYKEEGRSHSEEEVCIEGATELKVRITGETEENQDYITISQPDSLQYRKSFSGLLNVLATIAGPCVFLDFSTDSTNKIGDGPTVTVTENIHTGSIAWTPKYTNNANESMELCNLGTNSYYGLNLYISGETEENNDFLIVNEKHHFSGKFEDETYLNPVAGFFTTNCAKLRFQTNNSVIQGEGPTVLLTYPDP